MAVRGLFSLYETMFRPESVPGGSTSAEDIPTTRDLGGVVVPGATTRAGGHEERATLHASFADQTDEYDALVI